MRVNVPAFEHKCIKSHLKSKINKPCAGKIIRGTLTLGKNTLELIFLVLSIKKAIQNLS